MKPIPWDWDYLIHRHLEGGLTEEQARALNARLISHPALRRHLAELTFDQVVLGKAAAVIVGGGPAPLLKPRHRRQSPSPARRKKPAKSEGRKQDLT